MKFLKASNQKRFMKLRLESDWKVNKFLTEKV